MCDGGAGGDGDKTTNSSKSRFGSGGSVVAVTIVVSPYQLLYCLICITCARHIMQDGMQLR